MLQNTDIMHDTSAKRSQNVDFTPTDMLSQYVEGCSSQRPRRIHRAHRPPRLTLGEGGGEEEGCC